MFLLGAPIWAEPDVFMRAVSFALTGRDDADPKVIGARTNCVFAINNDLFRLNNVHTDRLTIQGWHRQRAWGLEQWVTVRLHGDDVLFEETIEPPKDDGSELMRQMRESSPELFKSHHYHIGPRYFASAATCIWTILSGLGGGSPFLSL